MNQQSESSQAMAKSPNTYIPGLPIETTIAPDHFIVCGLGSLGQLTIVNLKKFSFEPFEVLITAIDQDALLTWEVPNLPDLLSQPPIIGDCRQDEVLKLAGIEQCRAILIVTSEESVNIETAMTARRLNPMVQIIVRSSRHGLNQLLGKQLGRFSALDATELPAMTFALAGMGDDILSVFKVRNHQFRVVQQVVSAGDVRFDHFPMHRLHRRDSRLLDLKPAANPHQPIGWATTASSVFHRWQPHVRVQAGDQVVFVEVSTDQTTVLQHRKKGKRTLWERLRRRWLDAFDGEWRRQFKVFWQQDDQQSLRRISLIAMTTGIILWVVSTIIFKYTAQMSWLRAFVAGAILLLGGYGDLFGGVDPSLSAPAWVMMVCLLISLTSLLLVLGVFGLIADQILSSRFEFLRRRPRIPKQDHVIVAGLGRVGYRITRLLQELNQPLVVLTQQLQYSELQNEVPILLGDLLQELKAANLATAKSLIAVSDDPMLNLELALLASETAVAQGRQLVSVVRTLNQSFSNNLASLIPQAKSFSAYVLSAEAFAGAAFGESILGLFQLNEQTILVTEYHLESGDTLSDRPLFEITYGYGVVPILLRTLSGQGYWQDILMPSDDLRLHAGDKLYVLSSINGLRRIERGERTAPRRWRLDAEKPLSKETLLDAGNILANLSGVDLAQCRAFMESLPNSLELKLYDYQANRLMQELSKRLPITLSPLSIEDLRA
jgi:voltage-gated potassium channel Kch